MRPFWGIDVTRNKKNDHPDGDPLIVASSSASMAEDVNEATEQADAMEQKAKLPGWIRVIYSVCAVAALLIAGSILRADVTFEQGYKNAPALYWIGGVCGVIAIALFAWSKLRRSKVEESDEFEETVIRMDQATAAAAEELGIPADALDVDVLAGKYKIKDGKLKFCELSPMTAATFVNISAWAFVENDTLYLADVSNKYAIPLSEITCIRKGEKRAVFRGWNKPIPFKEPPYKEFKFGVNQFGDIFSKTHYILEFRHDGETWGVYFLPYELPVFTQLTGLNVTERAE